MNVQELIERLQEMDPEATVQLATQPSWPLRSSLLGVASASEIASEDKCDEHDFYNCDECSEGAENVVYLVEGSQNSEEPYAPQAAWDVCS